MYVATSYSVQKRLACWFPSSTLHSVSPVDSPVQNQAGITVQATVSDKPSRLGMYVLCFTDRGPEHHYYDKHWVTPLCAAQIDCQA